MPAIINKSRGLTCSNFFKETFYVCFLIPLKLLYTCLINLEFGQRQIFLYRWMIILKRDSLLGVGTEVIFGRTCNILNIRNPSGTNFSNAHLTTYLLFFFPLIATAMVEGKGSANASSCFSSIISLASMTQIAQSTKEFSLKWRGNSNKKCQNPTTYNIQQNPYSFSEMH